MIGLGVTDPLAEYNQAVSVITGGESIGSPIYQINLAAAKQQPGFNQSEFDQYWNALTISGHGYNSAVADSPSLPAFIKYTGTAWSNIPGAPGAPPAVVTPAVTPRPRGLFLARKPAPPLPPAPLPPVVVNPSPPSQPTTTGSSITAPGSVLSVANGTTLTATTTDPTQIISGIPNTALFIGAGALVLVLFAMGKK
jgi:hypothetical protein